MKNHLIIGFSSVYCALYDTYSILYTLYLPQYKAPHDVVVNCHYIDKLHFLFFFFLKNEHEQVKMLLYAYVLSFSNYISLLAEQTVSNGVVSSGTIWDFQSYNFLFEIV